MVKELNGASVYPTPTPSDQYQPLPAVNEGPISNPSLIQSKHWKIIASSPEDAEQYAKTAEALKQAKMTFEELDKAGKVKGDEVFQGETSAFLTENPEVLKVQDGIKFDENGVIAFQRRGEYTTLQNQIASPGAGQELVAASSAVVTQGQPQGRVEVIEGVSVIIKRNALEAQPEPTTMEFPQNPQTSQSLPINTPAENLGPNFLGPARDSDIKYS